jgi:hypothetical protein
VVLERIATANQDCVIALPPSGLRDAFLRVIRCVPGVTVAVLDTPESILERITFYGGCRIALHDSASTPQFAPRT